MISFSLSLYQAGSLERMSGTRSSHVPGSLFPPFTTREYKIVDIMKKKRKERKTAADFLPNFCLRVLWDGFNQAFFPPFIIISIIFLVEWSFAVERWIDLVCVCVGREREARGPIRPN